MNEVLKEIRRLNTILTTDAFMDAMTEDEVEDFNTAIETIRMAKETLNDIECAVFARLYC